MATPSMGIFTDSTDWLKNKNSEKTTPDSSSMDPISCMVAPPASSVFDRRLRPPHEEALKCPRCDSTNTKFCYYNNYSLTQPRYFCKTCRRYWTKGGSLRNVPVGGGCRRNKRPVSKKPAADATDLRLSFSDVQQPHLTTSQENTTLLGFNFMEYYKYNLMNESPAAGGLSVMDTNNNTNKSGAMLEDYMGIGDTSHGLTQLGFLGDDSNSSALWFANAAEGKTAVEWQEQYCNDIGRASVGYSNGIGMWAGMIDGHGPYGTNSY